MPKRRASVFPNDPGFKTFFLMRKPVRVFVDGVCIPGVHTADEEKGIAVAYVKTMPWHPEHGIAQAVYMGSVEIREADAKA